jgi:hypothetical protein
MGKQMKKVIIISAIIVAIIIIVAIVEKVYFWNTEPESICNRGGGFWSGVQGCDNYCDKTDKYCPDKLIFGCWCGIENCWDGKKCVEKVNK